MKNLRNLFLIFLVLNPVLTVQAEEVKLTGVFGENQVRLIMTLPRPNWYKYKVSERELIIQFAQGIPAVDAGQVLADGSEYIESVDYGFDSVLIKTTRKTEFKLANQSNTEILIKLSVKEDPEVWTPALETESTSGSLRMQLVKARVLLDQGKTDQSVKMVDQLVQDYPNDTMVLNTAASVKAYVGDDQQAFRLLERSADINPLGSGETLLYEELVRNQSSSVGISGEVIKSGDLATQNISRIKGEISLAQLSENLFFGISFENNQLEVEEGVLVSSDGLSDKFDDDRQRTAIWLRKADRYRNQYQAAVITGEEETGAALQYSRLDNFGETSFFLDINKLNWDYIELIPDYGVRDRLGLGRKHRFSRDWYGKLDVAWQRYGIESDSSLVKTLDLDGELSYLLLREDPIVRLTYALNAEYDLDSDEDSDAIVTNNQFFLFESREIHVISLAADVSLSEAFNLSGYGGYAFDRLGDGAPHFGLHLLCHLGRSLVARFSAGRTFRTTGLAGTGGNDEDDRFSGSLTWFF